MKQNQSVARRIVLTVITLLYIPYTVLANAEEANKPNIVLVVMDNFGYGEVGVYGGGELRGPPTPNIDSIAKEGFQSTNFNVEAECTPSRSALMTGRYGIRTRQRPEGPPRGVWYGITKWETTIAEMLTDADYTTGIFGKWHLGDTEGRFPVDQGFARESVIIYIGNTLFGAKWRNWKILLREMDEDSYAIQEMAYPSVYNLIIDPKEEVPELNYLDDTWVDFPLYDILEEHEASITNDPGAPDDP